MSDTLAGPKRRLAVLEKQAQGQTTLGIVVYDEIATGGTVVTTQDGRTFYGAEAEAMIAAQEARGGLGYGGITAICGICVDIVLGRVKYPGGPYDDLMRERGFEPLLEDGECDPAPEAEQPGSGG